MGNIFEAPPSSVDESLLYLNHNEIASTKELFDRLYKDDGAAYPRFLATFSSKLLADIFHFRLSQERYHSPKVFERFIIDCTRSGKAIPTLWELTRDKADNNLDGLNIFFAAISLMACPSKDGIFVIREDEDDVLLHRVPVKMLAFFQSYLYKIDPKFVQSCHETVYTKPSFGNTALLATLPVYLFIYAFVHLCPLSVYACFAPSYMPGFPFCHAKKFLIPLTTLRRTWKLAWNSGGYKRRGLIVIFVHRKYYQ